jgi:hypothetical protein
VAWGRGEVSRIREGDGCRGLCVTEWVLVRGDLEGAKLDDPVATHLIDQLLVARGWVVEVFHGPQATLDAVLEGSPDGDKIKS